MRHPSARSAGSSRPGPARWPCSASGSRLGGSNEASAPQPSAAKRSLAPLVERIDLPSNVAPGEIAAANGLVFVADERNPQIVVIDPDTRRVLDPVKVRRPVHDLDLSFAGDRLWATLEDGWIVDIELATAKKTYVRADIDVRRLAVTTTDVIGISTAEDGRRLQKIDAERHRPAGEPVESGAPTAALEPHGDGALQLRPEPSTTLTFWDEGLQQPFDLEIPVDGAGIAVLNTGGTVWVPTVDTHWLMSFNITTGEQAAKVPMPPKPSGLDWEGELLWVACRSGFVQRVHAKSARKVGDPIDTGPLLGPIDVGLGVAWATGPGYVVRIENRDRPTEG